MKLTIIHSQRIYQQHSKTSHQPKLKQRMPPPPISISELGIQGIVPKTQGEHSNVLYTIGKGLLVLIL